MPTRVLAMTEREYLAWSVRHAHEAPEPDSREEHLYQAGLAGVVLGIYLLILMASVTFLQEVLR